jgi:hypothetical protein
MFDNILIASKKILPPFLREWQDKVLYGYAKHPSTALKLRSG